MTTAPLRQVFGSVDALGADVVDATLAAAAAAIAARGIFTLALTGGSAASALYPLLAQLPLPWAQVHLFFGDERAVPADHVDSNFHGAERAFFGRCPIPADNVHRIRGEDDPVVAARAAEATLLAVTGGSGALDVVHLGLGPDGHVCSLFPGHALLRNETALVAALTDSPKPPAARVTLTLQGLSRARELWFLVLGANKDEAVRTTLLQPGSMLPAAQAMRRSPRARWWLDADAARLLTL